MTEFDNKIAVITGGANGIGKCIVEEFRKNGSKVCIIDKAEGDQHHEGDCGHDHCEEHNCKGN